MAQPKIAPMISRRDCSLGATALTAAGIASIGWRAKKRAFLGSECVSNCFEEDWLGFGYNKFYSSLLNLDGPANLLVLPLDRLSGREYVVRLAAIAYTAPCL